MSPQEFEPKNSSIPRIFIAASEQNAGKTTTSLGLHCLLRPLFPRIGYIKPVGQRFVDFEGKSIDEDSVLIRQTFGTDTPIEDMSPITVYPSFTRQHLGGQGNLELMERLIEAFDRAAWEKDFVIIEGTGHAGVGSVFGLSNAKVARLLRSKVILVVPGGIGRPIDEASLNKALFDREEVEIAGVIMNKVLPEKMEELREIAGRGLRHLGLDLLALLPAAPVLAQPTLHEIRSHIHGHFVSGPGGDRSRVAHILIGASSSANLIGRIRAGTLMICPGDREDVILAALAEFNAGTDMAGLILTDHLLPHARILKLAQESRLPAIQTSLDSFTVAKRITSLTVKTLPGDTQKLETIARLFQANFPLEALLTKLGIRDAAGTPCPHSPCPLSPAAGQDAQAPFRQP